MMCVEYWKHPCFLIPCLQSVFSSISVLTSEGFPLHLCRYTLPNYTYGFPLYLCIMFTTFTWLLLVLNIYLTNIKRSFLTVLPTKGNTCFSGGYSWQEKVVYSAGYQKWKRPAKNFFIKYWSSFTSSIILLIRKTAWIFSLSTSVSHLIRDVLELFFVL